MVEILSSDALVEKRYRGCVGKHCVQRLIARHRSLWEQEEIASQGFPMGQLRYDVCFALPMDHAVVLT